MALTNVFVTRYLLQETEAALHPIRWSETESGGWTTEVNGLRLDLSENQSRAGTLVSIQVRQGPEKIFITEPQSTSVFGRKYRSDDDATLAELLRNLVKAAAAQCAARRQRGALEADVVRQSLLQQLVFGVEAPAGASTRG
jgi:hypothetical protein